MKRILIGILLIVLAFGVLHLAITLSANDSKTTVQIKVPGDSDVVPLYLFGAIDATTPLVFEKLLSDAKTAGEKVRIIISSPGGDVFAGMQLIDVLKKYDDVIVEYYVRGYACSMAAIILAQAPVGKRFAAPHSLIMFHDMSLGLQGKYQEVKALGDYIAGVRTEVIEILAKVFGKTPAEMEQWILTDHWLTPAEALKLKVIDGIKN